MSTDREKIAMLVRHWIDHNEGHRTSYLEWRDKLSSQDLPATLAALQEVADLTLKANEALELAAAELTGDGAGQGAAGEGKHSHDHHPHGHEHGHHHEHGHTH